MAVVEPGDPEGQWWSQRVCGGARAAVVELEEREGQWWSQRVSGGAIGSVVEPEGLRWS